MDIRGACSDVKVYANIFEKTEETPSAYSISCRSSGSVTISENIFNDCKKIYLAKESSDIWVYGQDVIVRNDSQSNTVD